MNIIQQFKAAYGKSKPQTGENEPLSLHNHVLDATRVVAHILSHSCPADYDRTRVDTLVLATYLHDIGKLNAIFKEMLWRVCHNESLVGLKKVKHEASTFEFSDSVTREDLQAVTEVVGQTTGYQIDLRRIGEVQKRDIWGFAVSHHGLFYVSYENCPEPIPRIRRQWTTFYPRETARLTFADLLLEYHPLGGVVVVGDLVASYCHGEDMEVDTVLREYESMEEFIALLRPHLGKIEEQLKRDDRRDYLLDDMIRLLIPTRRIP